LKKKILIIGGTGFIGFHIAQKLIKKKYIVFSLSLKKPIKTRFLRGVKYLFADTSDFKNLKQKISLNFDYVLNASGNIDHKNKDMTYSSHYKGLKNLVNIFKKKKIKAFIQLGSSLENGNTLSPQKETLKCRPKSHYSRAKLQATKYIIKNKKFPYIILRLYQIYGPNQKTDRLIPYIISSCVKNLKFSCTEGIQKRDFLFIDDLSNLISKIIKKNKIKKGIYNVGSGKPKKIKSLINDIQSSINKGFPQYGKIKMRKDEILNLYPDIKKTTETFSWKPRIKLKDGLSRTIRFYEKKK
tara:strand:+ start:1469 stop:2362 length:894 start_codon:yes stop_codon:yes gene_type:complete